MKSPAFQFYSADFLLGTARMSLTERGAYITLLCHQWDGGGMSMEEAERLIGGPVPQSVLSKFVMVDGRLVNQRLEDVRNKQNAYRAAKIAAGVQSGRVRREQNSNRTRTELEQSCEQNTEQNTNSPVSGLRSSKNTGSGVLKSPVSGEMPSAFADMVNEDLRSDVTLMRWYRFATTKPSPVLPASETNLLNVFAAAERSLEKGKNPIAMFAKIVSRQDWNRTTADQEDRARKRIKNLNGVAHANT